MNHIHLDSENDINADPLNPSGELVYVVTDVLLSENEADVIQYIHNKSPVYLTFPVTNLMASIPNTLTGRIYRKSCKPRPFGNDFIVTVQYGQLDVVAGPAIGGQNPGKNESDGGSGGNEILGPEYDIESSSGTIHITQLDETVKNGKKRMERRYRSRINELGAVVDAPDLKGAIGVSRDKVEGVDIPQSKETWSVNVTGLPVTKNYRKYLRGMLNTLNLTKFFDAEPEELLFIAYKLRYRSGQGWTGTFVFEESENQTDVVIGGITFASIKGHDHVWCTFKDVIEADGSGKKIKLQKADCIYVDRLFKLAEHSGLFEGVG